MEFTAVQVKIYFWVLIALDETGYNLTSNDGQSGYKFPDNRAIHSNSGLIWAVISIMAVPKSSRIPTPYFLRGLNVWHVHDQDFIWFIVSICVM